MLDFIILVLVTKKKCNISTSIHVLSKTFLMNYKEQISFQVLDI